MKRKALLLLLLVPISVWLASLGGARETSSAETRAHLIPETGAAAPLSERIGVNVVYANVPSDIAQVAGWVRDYHRWYWYEPEEGKLIWSSSKQQIDRFYANLSGQGLRTLVNVGMVPAWASSNGKTSGLPFPKGTSGSNAADYLAHAEYLAQLAARFGSTRHDSGLATSDGISGTGYVQAIENWNEPNQNWAEPRFPAAAFGRMLETDYDGTGLSQDGASHLTGIKRGDPNMLSVLAGLAWADTAYLDAALKSRQMAGRVPFDIISFHWFAKGDTSRGGKAPEAAGLDKAVAVMRQWRDSSAPGTPIWLTEFGWDTNSRVTTGRSNLYVDENTAAAYLMRASIIALANGADKAFMFTYRDDDSTSSQQYSTSGLVENTTAREGDDARKKAGWYYMATMKSVLGNMVLKSIDKQGEGTPSTYLYTLAEPGGSRQAAIAWVRNPKVERDDGTYLKGFQVGVPWATTARLISPQNGSATGTSIDLNIKLQGTPAASVEIALTETPVIVEYGRK